MCRMPQRDPASKARGLASNSDVRKGVQRPPPEGPPAGGRSEVESQKGESHRPITNLVF